MIILYIINKDLVMLLSDFCSNVLHVLFNNGFRFKPSRFGGESTGSKAWGLGSFNDSLITPMQSYYGESFAGQSSMPEFYYPNIKSYLSVAMQQIWWNDETVKFSDINIVAFYCYCCMIDVLSNEMSEDKTSVEAFIKSFHGKYYEKSNVTRFTAKTFGGLDLVWFKKGNVSLSEAPFSIQAGIKKIQIFRGREQHLLNNISIYGEEKWSD